MKVGVVVFPGSNCDHDAWYAINKNLNRPGQNVTIAGFSPGSPWFGVSAEQFNTTKAGVVGVNWLAGKNFRVHAESEFGTNDNPFTPVSLRDYHSVRARAQYRTKKYTVGGAYADNYNANSVAITAYNSRARSYSGEGSWSAKSGCRWMGRGRSCIRIRRGGLTFLPGLLGRR